MSARPPRVGRGRSGRLSRALVCALLLVGAAVLVDAPSASAAQFAVSTTADGGAGSLRDAFAQASLSGTANEVVLQAGATYLLDDCGEGDLDYTSTQPLTITGKGATIQQTCAERVIDTDGDLTVTDATIRGGNQAGGFGGGIGADTADVTLVRSTVTDNRASTGGGVGAIHATLVDSTVYGNTASSTGGGVWADQTLDATNSTITGNSAGTSGGGLVVVNTSITLLYVTVVANTAPKGANLQVQAGGDALVSFASVVARPLGGGTDCDIDAGAVTTSQGYNFSSDASCGFGAGPGDVPAGGDPKLLPLAPYGGPTLTMHPDVGSPLLDTVVCAASPKSVTTDQRGLPRPDAHDPRCDIGAVAVVVVATAASAPPSESGAPPNISQGGETGDRPLRFTG